MRRKRHSERSIYSKNREEENMGKALDQLADFEEFTRLIPKQIRDALLRGAKASEIYKEFSHVAAARAVLIAMTEKDAGKALAAIKDIQDRADGKPTERKEIRHHMDLLSDEELDAALLSELDEIGEAKE